MSNEFVQIREAERGDAPDIARVHADAWRSTYQGIIPHLHLERIIAYRGPGWWARGMRKADSGLLVLRFDGAIQGYASFGAARILSGPRTGEIFELYLAPTFQGLGFGKKLFMAARRALETRGRRSLIVWALAENKSACAFYERLGGRLSATAPEQYGEVTLNRVAFFWEPVRRHAR
jgi:ribosomal protein S18 acetylase RimI-like enzyme